MPTFRIFPSRGECADRLNAATAAANESFTKFQAAHDEHEAAVGRLFYTVAFVRALEAMRDKPRAK